VLFNLTKNCTQESFKKSLYSYDFVKVNQMIVESPNKKISLNHATNFLMPEIDFNIKNVSVVGILNDIYIKCSKFTATSNFFEVRKVQKLQKYL
jgi:hypothetical protein